MFKTPEGHGVSTVGRTRLHPREACLRLGGDTQGPVGPIDADPVKIPIARVETEISGQLPAAGTKVGAGHREEVGGHS